MELKTTAFLKDRPAPGRTRPGPGHAGLPQTGRLPSHRGSLAPAEGAPSSRPPSGRLTRGRRRRAPAGRSPHSAHLRRSPPPPLGSIGAAGKEEEREEVLSPGRGAWEEVRLPAASAAAFRPCIYIYVYLFFQKCAASVLLILSK